MAVSNPCCCSLQTGTKVIAIINLILNIIGVIFVLIGILGAIGLTVAASSSETRFHEDEDANRSAKAAAGAAGIFVIVIMFILLVSCMLNLALSIVLLLGANQRNYAKCRAWFIVTIIFTVIFVIRSISGTWQAASQFGAGAAASQFVGFLIGLAIVAYELWVVKAFMEEIREGGPPPVAGYVHNVPGSGAQGGYVYTKPDDGSAAPPYGQPMVQGYTPVATNPQSGGFVYPKLDEEKGMNA